MAADKDAVEQMLGKWVLELPELANMRRSESEDVKAFLTRLIDEVRLAYDRRMSQFPRQCVFMGTTNAEEYLKDPTGARRFWPLYVRVPMIDTEKLEAERDQLWAEAFQIWAEMCAKFDYRNLPLMLDGEALREAEQLQSMAQEESSAVATGAAIEAWLNKPQRLSKFTEKDIGGMTGDDPLVIPVVTTPRQAFCEATGISNAEMAKNRTLDNAAGEAMKHVHGWHKAGSRLKVPGYGNGNRYVRNGSTPFERAQRYRFVEPNDSVDDLL